MIIAMTLQMSGGRSDDRPWPPPWVPFEVTQEEGEGSVRSHSAVDVTGKVSPEDLAPHLRLRTGYVTPPAPVSLPSETAAGPVEAPPLDQERDNEIAEAMDREVSLDAADAAEPETRRQDEFGGSDPPEPEEVPEPPKPADPKQAWIDYAVTQGLAEDQAAAMTKADLMSRFGGRL